MMKRWIVRFGLFAAVIAAIWFYSDGEIVHSARQYIENSDLLTVEARYTPEQIMETQKKVLVGDVTRTFQEPKIGYLPYLLLEVKFVDSNKKTREGIILWGQTDGEMIIDTAKWEKTHGFEDTLQAGATRNDFRVLQALADHKGSMSLDDLHKELRIELPTLDSWLQSTQSKHLTIQKGQEIQLHFEDPRFHVLPQTKLNVPLVTKSNQNTYRIGRHFSRSQIEKIAQAAFGPEFSIRRVQDLYLPFYILQATNPDGSTYTTYWNALNGEQIPGRYLTSR